jgi:hypothetical protein
VCVGNPDGVRLFSCLYVQDVCGVQGVYMSPRSPSSRPGGVLCERVAKDRLTVIIAHFGVSAFLVSSGFGVLVYDGSNNIVVLGYVLLFFPIWQWALVLPATLCFVLVRREGVGLALLTCSMSTSIVWFWAHWTWWR